MEKEFWQTQYLNLKEENEQLENHIGHLKEENRLYEQALRQIVEIGRRTYKTESEIIAEKVLMD